MQTLNLLQAQSSKQFSEDQTQKILAGLINYLKDDDQPEHMTPDQAAAMGKAAFARIGK